MSCPQIPEDLSPRSFHSQFEHNTNIWASRNSSGLMKLEGYVGMMSPDALKVQTAEGKRGRGHCVFVGLEEVVE